MTILVDASALVAIATRESDAFDLLDTLKEHSDRLCCAVGLWEAALAIARKRAVDLGEAARALDSLRADLDLKMVAVADSEARLALEAHRRFGKGTGHPAQLNMGDCFAYACAKANGARLLYKGSDFALTDLA